MIADEITLLSETSRELVMQSKIELYRSEAKKLIEDGTSIAAMRYPLKCAVDNERYEQAAGIQKAINELRG